MWMLAIFFPYIALLKLRRYTEATIIALIWVLAIPFIVFSFGLLAIPIIGFLSTTSLLAGLYTGQYYSAQRNDKLIDAITSAALLVSGKEVVAQPVETYGQSETPEENYQASFAHPTPTTPPAPEIRPIAPSDPNYRHRPRWSAPKTLIVVIGAALLASAATASYPTYYYVKTECAGQYRSAILGKRGEHPWTPFCHATVYAFEAFHLQNQLSANAALISGSPVIDKPPPNFSTPTPWPPPTQSEVKIAPPSPQPDTQQPSQPEQVATAPLTESPEPQKAKPTDTESNRTNSSQWACCLRYYEGERSLEGWGPAERCRHNMPALKMDWCAGVRREEAQRATGEGCSVMINTYRSMLASGQMDYESDAARYIRRQCHVR